MKNFILAYKFALRDFQAAGLPNVIGLALFQVLVVITIVMSPISQSVPIGIFGLIISVALTPAIISPRSLEFVFQVKQQFYALVSLAGAAWTVAVVFNKIDLPIILSVALPGLLAFSCAYIGARIITMREAHCPNKRRLFKCVASKMLNSLLVATIPLAALYPIMLLNIGATMMLGGAPTLLSTAASILTSTILILPLLNFATLSAMHYLALAFAREETEL